MKNERRYPNPPITEVAVTVKFAPLLVDLTVLDCANLYRLFEARYSSFRQITPAGAMPVNPAEAVAPQSIALPTPRLQFSTEEGDRSVLFQADGMTFLWTRISLLEEEADYPLFPQILENFFKELQVLLDWMRDGHFIEVSPAVAEVAYNTAFKMRRGEQKRSLSDVFTFFNNPESVPMRAFSVSWAEFLEEEKPNDGMITVAVTGPQVSADGVPVSTLSLTGTSAVQNSPWDSLAPHLQFIHDRLARTFDRLVQEKALQRAAK